MTHDEIINRLGGYKAVADACGVHAARANHWTRDGIPSRHWLAVQAMAKAKRVRGISVQILADSAPDHSGRNLRSQQHGPVRRGRGVTQMSEAR